MSTTDIKNSDLQLTIKKHSDISFMKSHIDFERYVRVHASNFSEIFSESLKETNNINSLEGLVAIHNKRNNKTIYRKLIGGNINSKDIEMGYRTQCELKVKDGEEVDVKPTNWFNYYWCNSESYYKHPFRIAFVAMVITFLSFLISIASYMK